MAVKKNLDKSEAPEVAPEVVEEKPVEVSLKDHPSGNHTVFTTKGVAIFKEGKAVVTKELKKVLETLGII